MYLKIIWLDSFIKLGVGMMERKLARVFINSSIQRIALLVLSIFLLSFSNLHSEEKTISAKEILKMDIDSAFELIGRLNKTQTAELITQIRLVAREEYKDIDKFYLLISHLETMKAIEEEEKKLKDLNLVYGLALGLFVVLIGYNIFSQKKSLQKIEDYFKQ